MHDTPHPRFGIEPDLEALARIASRVPELDAARSAAAELGFRLGAHVAQQCEIDDYALTAPAERALAIEFARRHHAERVAGLAREIADLTNRYSLLAWADNADLAAAGGHVVSWN